MPLQERLWLNDEQGLLPGLDHPGQKHQEHPIRFGTDWSFDLSAKDDQLLSQTRFLLRVRTSFERGQSQFPT